MVLTMNTEDAEIQDWRTRRDAALAEFKTPDGEVIWNQVRAYDETRTEFGDEAYELLERLTDDKRKALALRTEIDAEDGEVLSQLWTCECGSNSFHYEENYSTWRSVVRNEPEGITLSGDFDWGDGDDDPGLVCDGCGAAMKIPAECEMDYS